jgi:hypothetical protein
MRTRIHNIEDLRSEISRLRVQRNEYEDEMLQFSKKIADKFEGPMTLINKVSDLFSTFFKDDKDQVSGRKDSDWITSIFRFGLPVFMNRFFFRKSGIITKSIIALVSQKAATSLNMDTFTSLIDKASEWIRGNANRPRKRKNPVLKDYGIPPDSETY